ncbi:MAG: hypothetical protein ACE5GN_05955, partial [Waddliaceae bacterium]
MTGSSPIEPIGGATPPQKPLTTEEVREKETPPIQRADKGKRGEETRPVRDVQQATPRELSKPGQEIDIRIVPQDRVKGLVDFFEGASQKLEETSTEIKSDVETLEEAPVLLPSFFQWAEQNLDDSFVTQIIDSIKDGRLDPDKTRKNIDYLKARDKKWETAEKVKDSFSTVSGTVLSILGGRIIRPFALGASIGADVYERATGADLSEFRFLDITGMASDITKVADLFHAVPQTIAQASFLAMHSYLLDKVAAKLIKMKEEFKVNQDPELEKEIEKVEQWLADQWEANVESWVGLGIKSVTSLPTWIKAGGTFANWISALRGGEFKFSPVASNALGYAGIFA